VHLRTHSTYHTTPPHATAYLLPLHTFFHAQHRCIPLVLDVLPHCAAYHQAAASLPFAAWTFTYLLGSYATDPPLLCGAILVHPQNNGAICLFPTVTGRTPFCCLPCTARCLRRTACRCAIRAPVGSLPALLKRTLEGGKEITYLLHVLHLPSPHLPAPPAPLPTCPCLPPHTASRTLPHPLPHPPPARSPPAPSPHITPRCYPITLTPHFAHTLDPHHHTPARTRVVHTFRLNLYGLKYPQGTSAYALARTYTRYVAVTAERLRLVLQYRLLRLTRNNAAHHGRGPTCPFLRTPGASLSPLQDALAVHHCHAHHLQRHMPAFAAFYLAGRSRPGAGFTTVPRTPRYRTHCWRRGQRGCFLPRFGRSIHGSIPCRTVDRWRGLRCCRARTRVSCGFPATRTYRCGLLYEPAHYAVYRQRSRVAYAFMAGTVEPAHRDITDPTPHRAAPPQRTAPLTRAPRRQSAARKNTTFCTRAHRMRQTRCATHTFCILVRLHNLPRVARQASLLPYHICGTQKSLPLYGPSAFSTLHHHYLCHYTTYTPPALLHTTPLQAYLR